MVIKNVIKISDFIDQALTDNDGMLIRTEIDKLWNNNYQEVILDFNHISYFTTDFFSASLCYYLSFMSVCELFRLITFDNIPKWAMHTFFTCIKCAEITLKSTFRKEDT